MLAGRREERKVGGHTRNILLYCKTGCATAAPSNATTFAAEPPYEADHEEGKMPISTGFGGIAAVSEVRSLRAC